MSCKTYKTQLACHKRRHLRNLVRAWYGMRMVLAGTLDLGLACINISVEPGTSYEEFMHYIIAQPTAEEACQAFFSIQSLLIPAMEESHGEMEINDLFNMIQAHMAKIWLVFERDSKKLVGAAATETTE